MSSQLTSPRRPRRILRTHQLRETGATIHLNLRLLEEHSHAIENRPTTTLSSPPSPTSSATKSQPPWPTHQRPPLRPPPETQSPALQCSPRPLPPPTKPARGAAASPLRHTHALISVIPAPERESPRPTSEAPNHPPPPPLRRSAASRTRCGHRRVGGQRCARRSQFWWGGARSARQPSSRLDTPPPVLLRESRAKQQRSPGWSFRLTLVIASPALNFPRRAHSTGVMVASANSRPLTIWDLSLPVVVGSPTRDLSRSAQTTHVGGTQAYASADGGERPLRSREQTRAVGCLAYDLFRLAQRAITTTGAQRGECPCPRYSALASPALDRSSRAQGTGIGPPRTDGGEFAGRWAGMPEVGVGSRPSASPALNFACHMQTAGVCITARDGCEDSPRWWATLSEDIASPTYDLTRVAHSAGMVLTGTDSGESPGGRVCLAPANAELFFDRGVLISTPAYDFACATKAASVPETSADRYEASGLRCDCDLGTAQPAVRRGGGGEVARRRQDTLAVGGGEGEFDPPIVRQAGVDAADFCSSDLNGARVEPAVVLDIRGEVAQARQHAHSAGRLPAELGAAISEAAGGDLPADLLVALRVGALREVGDDDRDRGHKGGDGYQNKSFPPPHRTNVLAMRFALSPDHTLPSSCLAMAGEAKRGDLRGQARYLGSCRKRAPGGRRLPGGGKRDHRLFNAHRNRLRRRPSPRVAQPRPVSVIPAPP